VAETVDTERYRSLSQMCLARCAADGERTAFENMGATLTYGELERDSRAFAGYLARSLSLARGDRVAIMLPNMLQSPICILGALRAGLVVVNVNPLYTARELEHQLADSGARVIIVLENFAGTVEKVLAKTAVEHVIVTRVGDRLGGIKGVVANIVVRYVRRQVPPWHIKGAIAYADALTIGSGLDYLETEPGPDELAFLQYTGGTTGVAKGAMLSHRNVVANVLQLVAWVDPFIDRESDAVLTPLPLYHIFALTVNLFAFIELGVRNVLITNPRDMKSFVRTLSRTPIAFMTGVNTLFNALVSAPGFERVDFGALKVVLAGGMAVQSNVASRWKEVTGVSIVQGYGLTEASPVVSANPLDQQEFNGSIGLPLPNTDVVVLDDDGLRVPTGAIGEICVKGPQVMVGYWQRDDDSRATFTDDGWLRTGDIGRMDEQGYFYIEDRKKDVIIVSGFNVYPSEVEDVVTSHPGVVEAAAIGVEDERSGEAVKIFVVRRDQALTDKELLAYCRERLTGYKSPDFVEFVDELPKSNVGKVLRRELKKAKS
jgi:long-chain acyl-CoA synthetase